MASDDEKEDQGAADLMAVPEAPPRPWSHILIGLGGAIALALAAVVLIRFLLMTRPLDLLPTTQALGDHIGEVLKKNLVPPDAIKHGAPVLREETSCSWYHVTYDVDVPDQMSASGLRKLLVSAMSERQARVSSQDPLELSIGPYPFAIVNFHGGAPEPEADSHASGHAEEHAGEHAGEREPVEAASDAPEMPQEPEELRIPSLVLATIVEKTLVAAGAPAAAMAVGDPIEESSPKAVWMRTQIQLGDWTPPSLDKVRRALDEAVRPHRATVVEDSTGALTVLLMGEIAIEIEFAATGMAAISEPDSGEANATDAARDMGEVKDLSEVSDALAAKVRAGLLDGGVKPDLLLEAALGAQTEGGFTWNMTQFQVKGGTTIPPAELLAAVLRRAAGAGVEASLDESAGPPEIHVKLHGNLAVLVELRPVTPMKIPDAAPQTPKTSMDLPPETMVDGPVQEAEHAPVEAVDTPRIALILDDGGYGNGATEEILKLDPNLTLAILPYTPKGKETAERGKALGYEIMLHMPMQPIDSSINFQGQLNVGMSEDDIARLTREALETVPGAEGINNHTGSRFTSDPDSMKMFFEAIKDQPYFFIDSATSAKSKAYELAQEAGIPAAKRSVFLDDTNEANYIRKQFAILRGQAKRTGSAIGIGHFRPVTASVLREELQKIKDDGIELVHASTLVK